jgi:hypothetical protein
MTEDKRRAQYVPLDSNIAFGKTTPRLLGKFGKDGLLTWLLFLAAAKRSREQGVFVYTSEPEGWQLIGLTYPYVPEFSLDAFFVFTGRIRCTKIVRQGSVRRVSVVNWKSWNDEWKKQQTSERMSRKRAESTRTEPAQHAHIASTEYEGEVEGEYEGEAVGKSERPELLRKIETNGVVANVPGYFTKRLERGAA